MTKRIDLRSATTALRHSLRGPSGIRLTTQPLTGLLMAAEQAVAIRELMSIETLEHVKKFLGVANDTRPAGLALSRLEERLTESGNPPLLQRLESQASFLDFVSVALDHVRFAQQLVQASDDMLVRTELELLRDASSAYRSTGLVASSQPRYMSSTYAAIAALLARPDIRRVVYTGGADVGVMQLVCEEQLKRYQYPRLSLKLLRQASQQREAFVVGVMDIEAKWGGELSWNCEPGDEVESVQFMPAWMQFVGFMGEGPSYGDVVIDDCAGIGNAKLLRDRFRIVVQLRRDFQEISGTEVVFRNDECLVTARNPR